MRSFTTIICLSALQLIISCGGSSTSETKNVFGVDDRETITYPSGYLSAVGRLDSGCTGTLIDKDLF